ncbi:gamma carbonic anhydrase family protein, partial [Corynebacterium ureicelerivorans]|uniref:gamma carbonic anhydrase family protein n=1 Tax=Corynebacterium ureicelerivorans TaxID=401472 RepID=UPI0023548AAB
MIYSFEGHTPKIHPSAFISGDATIIGDVTIGEDANIWPGAVLRGDIGAIRIGDRVNVQDGAVIHVDTDGRAVLEDDVTVGHLAMVHGCHIEPGCLIGMN